MRTEDENVNNDKESSLLHLFRKLYDQQFPQMISCFKLISIKERIEDFKEEQHTHNGWMIRIGYLLLAIFAFNFQFADHIKAWGNSPYHLVVMWVTIGCAVWILISTLIRFVNHYERTINRYEMKLCSGGFDFYRDTEKLFLTLIQKFSWYDIKTPNELAEQIEKDVRFLVYLIKKSEAYPDSNKVNPFLKKFEDDLLKSFIDVICALRLMGVEESDNMTFAPTPNIYENRAAWLRKKLFDEVTI